MELLPKVLVTDVYGFKKLDIARRSQLDWAVLKSNSTTAVGDSDKALAKAVTLLVRAVDPWPIAQICILLNEEHLIKTDDCSGGDDDDGYDLSSLRLRDPIAYVESMDDRLIVFSEHLQAPEDSRRFLVYDADRKSLDVVPRPSSWYCTYPLTPGPFPVRSGDGNYTLAIMVKCNLYDMVLRREFLEDALCLWPPPPSSKPHPQGNIEPWKLKKPCFPKEKPEYFSADMTFSLKGQAFWIDLSQGVLFCDCEQILYGDYEVQFCYLPLPPECHLGQGCERAGSINLRRSRTMGFSSDDGTIKLVCIGKGCDCDGCGGPESPNEILVTMWVLDLHLGLWRRDNGSNEFLVASLWEIAAFKEAGLPQAEPIFPVLSTHQGGDIMMYFNIDKTEGTSSPNLLCRINMRTKEFFFCGPLTGLPTEPCVFASDFFKNSSNLGLFDHDLTAELLPISAKRKRHF